MLLALWLWEDWKQRKVTPSLEFVKDCGQCHGILLQRENWKPVKNTMGRIRNETMRASVKSRSSERERRMFSAAAN